MSWIFSKLAAEKDKLWRTLYSGHRMPQLGKEIDEQLCTHEGSGLGRSEKDIKKLCPKAKVTNGLAVRGGNVDNADKKIENWLKSI